MYRGPVFCGAPGGFGRTGRPREASPSVQSPPPHPPQILSSGPSPATEAPGFCPTATHSAPQTPWGEMRKMLQGTEPEDAGIHLGRRGTRRVPDHGPRWMVHRHVGLTNQTWAPLICKMSMMPTSVAVRGLSQVCEQES